MNEVLHRRKKQRFNVVRGQAIKHRRGQVITALCDRIVVEDGRRSFGKVLNSAMRDQLTSARAH